MGDIIITADNPAIPRGLIDDIFVRPDAATLGSATYVGGWNVIGGTGAIDTERGTLNGTGNDVHAVVDTGRADVRITTKVAAPSISTTWQPVVFRRVDGDNYWCVGVNGAGAYVIQAFNGGSASTRGSGGTAVSGDVLRVEAVGTTARLFVNGLLVVEDTGANWHSTATSHGFGHRNLGTGAPNRYWLYYRCEAV